MLVVFEVTNPMERAHTITKRQVKGEATEPKAILSGDDGFLRTAVRTEIQTALEAEMTEVLAAGRRVVSV
jgi:transposase-like protein